MGRLSLGQWLEVASWLAVAGKAYRYTLEFDRDVEMYRFGADGWPRLLILFIFLAAIGQFIQDLRGNGAGTGPGFLDSFADQGPGFVLRMGLTLALPLVYASLLQGMGFYFLTPFFLAGYLFLTGERRVVPLIFFPLGIFAVITLIFTRLLYVGLPTGYWPGFYDFGNWFVVLVRGL